MTPWGIRKKIKAALVGSSGPTATEKLSLTMTLPSGRSHTIDCEPGYTLAMASQILETPIATSCPDGGCGGCVVDVVEGTGLRAATAAEQKLLDEKKYGPNTRLACHAKVDGSGASIRVRTVWTMDSIKGT